MVLKESIFVRLSVYLLFSALASCSMMTKQDAKRVLIVPAQIPKQELKESEGSEMQGALVEEKIDSKAEYDQGAQQEELDTEEKNVRKVEKKIKSSSSSSDLLTTLLGKATKAMNLQQWLRAQRILEQALRINPQSSQIYVLYGDVYKGMGLEGKSMEMYKRAILLSGDDEQLKQKLFPEPVVD